MSTPGPTLNQPAKRVKITEAADDRRKIRRASFSVGMAVALASGMVVFIGFIVLVSVALNSAVVPGGFQIILGPDGLPAEIRQQTMGVYSIDSLIRTVAILAAISLVMSSLAGWFMAHRVVKPLAEALRLQRHFVSDASHELRTPLTALSLRVQLLKRHLASGKPVDDVVDQLQTDALTIQNVLNDMLLTAEGTTVLENAEASVTTCLNQAITSLRPQAEQSGVNINLAIAAELVVSVPEASLTRAIVAVVDNAIAHSPEGGSVEITVDHDNRNAIVRVRDHGTGITGVNPNRVFERFSHGTETGRKRSFGLGLALASEVAHRFGGNIQVESTSSEGTTFALSFPIT